MTDIDIQRSNEGSIIVSVKYCVCNLFNINLCVSVFSILVSIMIRLCAVEISIFYIWRTAEMMILVLLLFGYYYLVARLVARGLCSQYSIIIQYYSNDQYNYS